MDEGDEYVPQNSMLDYSLMDTGGGPAPGYDPQAADPYGMMRGAAGAPPVAGQPPLQAMNNMMPPQMHPGHPYGQQPPPQPQPQAPPPKPKGRRGKKAQEAAAAAASAATPQAPHPYGNPYGADLYGQQQAGAPGGAPQNPMHAMAAMSQNPMMARQRYPAPHPQAMPTDPYAQQQWYAQQQQQQQQQQYPPYRPQYPQQQYPGAPQQQGYYPPQQPQRPYYPPQPQPPPQQQQYGGPRYPTPQQNPYAGAYGAAPMEQQPNASGYGYPPSKAPAGYPGDWQAQQQQQPPPPQQQPQRPQYPAALAQLQEQMYRMQQDIPQLEAQLKSMSERVAVDPRAKEYAHQLEQRIYHMRSQYQQMQQHFAQQQQQMAQPGMYAPGSQQSAQMQQAPNPQAPQVSQHQQPTSQPQIQQPQSHPPPQTPQQHTPQMTPQPSTSEPVQVMQTAPNQVQVNINQPAQTSGQTLISVYHQYNASSVPQSQQQNCSSMDSPGKDQIPPEPTPSKIETTPQSQIMTPPQYASSQQTQVAPATSSGQPPTPEYTYGQQPTQPSSSTSTPAMEQEEFCNEPSGVVESSTGDDVVVSSEDVTGIPFMSNGDDDEGPSSSYSPEQTKLDDSAQQSPESQENRDDEDDEEDGRISRRSMGPIDPDSSDIPSESVPLEEEPSAESLDSMQNDSVQPTPSEITAEEPEESSMASESMDAPPSEQTLNEDEESMSQPMPEIVVQPPPVQEEFPQPDFPPVKKRGGGGGKKKGAGFPSTKKRKKPISEDEDLFDDEDRDFVLETKRSKSKKAKKTAEVSDVPEIDVPMEYIEKRRSTRAKKTTHSYKEKNDLDQEELEELMLPSGSNERRSKSRTVDDSRASTADGGDYTPMPNDDGDSMAASEVASELLAPVPNEWIVEKILGVRIREKKPQVKEDKPEENGENNEEPIGTDKPETSAESKAENDASPDDTEASTIPTEASSSSTSTVPTPSTMEEEGEEEEFLIKFKNKSYLHCQWHTMAELETLDKRSSGKVTRFKTKQANLPFQTDEDEYFNEDYTVVERVLDQSVEEKGDVYYFVKWRSLSYEECTWEISSVVPEERVLEFQERNSKVDPAKVKEKQRPSEREWTKLHPEKTYKDGNKLREYQFIGVDWLLFCYYNRKNCILADEMGLGKTVQTITFLQGVYDYGIHGPFLVVVPLSTLHNWEREFETWTNMNAVVYHGGAKSREIIQQYELYYENQDNAKKRNVHKFDALITTFEMVVSDCEVLKRIPYRVCVIDEAHRLKNRNCKLLTGGLLSFRMEHRVLLTGTPLQNNIHELFSLLNFLEPLQFHSSEQFLEKFGDCKTEEQVQKLQEILKPMMLRRLKEDVEKSLQPKEETIIEVQLSNAQKKYYRAILERNFTHLCKGTSAPSLMNTMMELRKCCNHPFLINGAEETIMSEMRMTTNCKTEEELLHYSLVQSSGKLVLIDKLLPKLRRDGHKVLIFSQMVRVLDILEEFLSNMK
uniref:Chromo domain-containing protein n=1 Tax=Steinernema glaseri TaxID=37863 RepID=A0A1I8AT61_9BILA